MESRKGDWRGQENQFKYTWFENVIIMTKSFYADLRNKL